LSPSLKSIHTSIHARESFTQHRSHRPSDASTPHHNCSVDGAGQQPPQEHSSLRILGKGSVLDEFQPDTRIVRGGFAGPEWTTDPLGRSLMNPPVWHASTITFPSVAALKQAASTGGLMYGRLGTPTTWALEEAFAVVEGGDNACVACSGVAATVAVLTAFVRAGDHILVSDGVYEQTRRYCDFVRSPPRDRRDAATAPTRQQRFKGRYPGALILRICIATVKCDRDRRRVRL
jgi:hypothetical protein